MRFGVERYVLYLPVPVQALDRIDGSRERRIRNKIEQFLKSPDGAIEKRPSEYVAQVKDRNSKMRAFATYCEAPSYDIFVVQAIYQKGDEDEFWADLPAYDMNGREYDEKFHEFSRSEAYDWLDAVRTKQGVLLVGQE